MKTFRKNIFIAAAFTLLSSPSWATELIASNSYLHENCEWDLVSQTGNRFHTASVHSLKCGAGEIAKKDTVSHSGGTFCYVTLTDNNYTQTGAACNNFSIVGELPTPPIIETCPSGTVSFGNNPTEVLQRARNACAPCDATIDTQDRGQTFRGFCRS